MVKHDVADRRPLKAETVRRFDRITYALDAGHNPLINGLAVFLETDFLERFVCRGMHADASKEKAAHRPRGRTRDSNLCAASLPALRLFRVRSPVRKHLAG